jgi:hypothetical protein
VEDAAEVEMPLALLSAPIVAVAPAAAPATTDTTPAELTVAIAVFEDENVSVAGFSVLILPSE